MYEFRMKFGYFDYIHNVRVIHRYAVEFDLEEYQIDIEVMRNTFINDILEEMRKVKAHQFFIYSSKVIKVF